MQKCKDKLYQNSDKTDTLKLVFKNMLVSTHPLDILENEHSTYRTANEYTDLLSDNMLNDILSVESDRMIYINLHSIFNDEPYSRSPAYTLRSVSYMYEDDVLRKYPVLKKYNNWKNLFEQHRDTNIYIMPSYESNWLSKKMRYYDIKEKIK